MGLGTVSAMDRPRAGTGTASYFQIAELGKLLPAVVQEASEGLGLLVGDFVGADIAPLSEFLLADIARERLLPCVAPLMGLRNMSALTISGFWGGMSCL